jgi:hypothetical protein
MNEAYTISRKSPILNMSKVSGRHARITKIDTLPHRRANRKNQVNYAFFADYIKKANPTQLSVLVKKIESPSKSINPLKIKAKKVLSLYIVEEPNLVCDYLIKYPSIIDLLFEGEPIILKFFPNAQVHLKLVSDVEYPDWEKLVLFIVVCSEEGDSVESLFRLDDEWWIEASMNNPSGNKLSIELGFNEF